MEPVHKLLFEFVNKCLLSRSERRHETSYLDLAVMEVMDQNRPINLPLLMIKHVARSVDKEKYTPTLPSRFLLTRVFEHFEVPLRGPKKGAKKYMFDEETLKECDFVARPPATKSKSMVTNLLEELIAPMRKKRS